MSQSNWPEPTRDETEPPRWGRIVAVVAVAAIAAWVIARREGQHQSFSLPEITMPDLRGRAEQAPPVDASVSENVTEPPFAFDPFAAAASGASVQSVPFESCVESAQSLGGAVGQTPVVVEDTAQRRVVLYKFEEGNLTVTCSRADNTMRIEQN